LKLLANSAKMRAGFACGPLNRKPVIGDDGSSRCREPREGSMTIRLAPVLLGWLAICAGGAAQAQLCSKAGDVVTCDDGRHGMLSGNAILWPDGTRSSGSPHPSVIIGNKSSISVGPGVFVGQGKGVVPMDDPNAPNKTRCAILDGVSYCY
jgi:hypothetical protein